MRRITVAIGAAAFALAGVRAFLAGSAAAQEAVTIRPDLSYARHGGIDLTLDAYLPPGGGEDRSAVVWLHGGRWKGGDKVDRSDVEIAATIAEQGFVVFSVNYRLSSLGGFPYPAAVEDVTAAVEWIRDHAADFGVDPARIAAAGNSSGGHLAALLGTLGEGPLTRGARVAAVVSFSGPMDLEALLSDENENVAAAVSQFLGCSGGPACEATARQASPLTHVDATDAPMLMANSTQEAIPLAQATAMERALGRAGVAGSVIEVEGRQHGLGYMSWINPLGPNRETLPELYLGFLGDRLGIDVDPRRPATAPEGPTPVPSKQPKIGPGTIAAPEQVPLKRSEEADEGGSGVEPGLVPAAILAVILASVSLTTAIALARRRFAGASLRERSPGPQGAGASRRGS